MDEMEKMLNELVAEDKARRSLIDITSEWDAACLEETVRLSLTPEQQAAALYEAAPELDIAISDDWEMGYSESWNEVTV